MNISFEKEYVVLFLLYFAQVKRCNKKYKEELLHVAKQITKVER